MRSSTTQLTSAYSKRLNVLYSAQERSMKCLTKLSYAAFTDELRSGLTPESFDQPQHSDRLKQCFKLAQLKPAKTADEPLISLFSQAELTRKASRVPSIYRDLCLLHSGLKILNMGQCASHELFLMAASLGQDLAATLLEQCWKDYQNAYN